MERLYDGKKILILGLARSGIAAAELLCKNGAQVTLSDRKNLGDFDDSLNRVIRMGCRAELGRDVDRELLQNQDMMIISPGVPIDAPAVKLAREMGVPVIGEMEAASRLLPCPMIAVTGTNGKTTTVSLLGEIFQASGTNCHVCGNIGYPVSAAAMECGEEDMVVCEVSSFQLESIETFHPLSAAVLNITEDHLNRHGTMEVYIGLKKHIFANQSGEDYAVLNADDPITCTIAEGLNGKVLWFSRKREVENGAFVRDGKMILRNDGEECTVCDVKDIYIPGPHNLENALAAALMAWTRGVDPKVICRVLKEFKGVEHRIEFVRELDGIRYINDSKGTNTDSTIKAVEAMTRPTAIILGGYDKHVSFVPLAKCMKVSPYMKHAVLIGVTADQIERELRQEGFTAISRAETLKEAVLKCRKSCSEGSNVLLSPSCASFDMFSDYEQRGRVFKQIVAELKGKKEDAE